MKRNLNIEEIEKVFDKVGLQATAQRIAIYKYLYEEPKHVTVDEIKEWTDKNFPKLSLATVYNTINSLLEHGLIKFVKLNNSDKVIYDSNTSKHYHFFDKEKNQLKDIDIDISYIENQLKEKYNISDISLVVYGTEK
ncbi:MAG: Fur family transcriptional regulator [Candidatus Sericytochromatia bacterium]|nr:MAG: Fur family transcriptional regulator [Candidatus Sericytochromatia bacterium]